MSVTCHKCQKTHRGVCVQYRQLPDVAAKPVPEWATYIEGRWSKPFKVHTTLGLAKSAITNHGHGILYRFMRPFEHRDLEWTAVAVISSGDRDNHPLWSRKNYLPTEPVVLFVIQEELI